MFTNAALREIHERTHHSLRKLLDHCRTLDGDALDRELEHFAYPTVRLQLHHALGAEKYWTGVLEGRIDADEDDPKYPTIASLEAYREEVHSITKRYLRTASPEELNTPRKMTTWGNNEKVLTPTHVFLRTQMHIFHHQGQVLAMCRLMGKPANGFDYPID